MTARVEYPVVKACILRALRPAKLAMVIAIAGLAILGDLAVLVAGAGSADAPPHTIADLARLAIEVPQPGDPSLSPDGTGLLFTVARWSVADNHVVTELQLKVMASDHAPSVVARVVRPRGRYQFDTRWCPDSTCFTFRAADVPDGSRTAPLLRYDLRAQQAAPIPVHDTESDRVIAGVRKRPPITAVGVDYKWAPSGTTLAFTAPLESFKPPTPLIGVRIEGAELVRNQSLSLPAPKVTQALFELDIHTGRLRQLSPATLSVSNFDWAPDSQSIAIGAVPSESSADDPESTDLFIIDRATRAVRVLVSQPGTDGKPTWSPDGRWIAIRTSWGKIRDWDYVAIIRAKGGKIIRLTTDDPVSLLPNSRDVYWLPDSRSFYYVTPSHMSRQIHRADVGAARVVSLPVDETTAMAQFDFSPDRRSLVFVCSAPNVPPELCMRVLPEGVSKQVTRLSPDFSLTSRVHFERIQWTSREGGTTLHGLLLTPRFVPGSGPEPTPLPTLVYLKGGPVMVDASYDQAHAQLLALVARGYAVFIPNTRGRLGYGTAYNFFKGFPDVLAYAHVPYQDMMTGIESLVRRGIVDPKRLGLFGHSYGGYLALFTVTQTHQFRALVDYEGVASDMVRASMRYQPKSTGETLNASIGVRNPFALDERDKLIAVSPALNMHCIATPTLMLFGAHTGAKANNAPILFSGFQRFGIPAELVLFDDGHLVERPTAKVDVAVRMAAWFDYWVRDLPYTEPALGAQYDAWRNDNESKRSQPPSCATGSGSH